MTQLGAAGKGVRVVMSGSLPRACDINRVPGPGPARRYHRAMSAEIEIGRSKRARRAYSFDDIAVVPARRTRNTRDVRVGWQVDAYHVDLPIMAAPMDSVMSPATAVLVGRLGGIGVLDLEGLWTRYEDPADALGRIRAAAPEEATRVLQEVYRPPVRPELIGARLAEIRRSGVVVAARLSPAQTQRHWRTVVEAGVDLLVIRGSVVSAEHVSGNVKPLNLKRFIYELDVPVVVGGVTTYTAALHLMRTSAAAVLVGCNFSNNTKNKAKKLLQHGWKSYKKS